VWIFKISDQIEQSNSIQFYPKSIQLFEFLRTLNITNLLDCSLSHYNGPLRSTKYWENTTACLQHKWPNAQTVAKPL